jgi:hypothetical protein
MPRYQPYQPNQVNPFRISRSKVDLFLNCPRCFYLDVRLGIKRPSGFPFNLNSAVDALLKKEFDEYRARKEPHPYLIANGINAIPYADDRLDVWRSNFKGVSYYNPTTNFETFGAVDDLWIDNNTNEIIVVDYKATSKNDEVTLDADWQIGYKRQMEFYQWLLRMNGLKVADKGWFVYCNGIKDTDGFDNKLHFDVKLIAYEGNGDWIEPTMLEIKQCLDSDTIPNTENECEYCGFAVKYKSLPIA